MRQRHLDDLCREHLVLFSFIALIAPVRTWDIEATPHIHLVLEELAGLDAHELGDAERGRKGIRGARRWRRLPLGCRHRATRGACNHPSPDNTVTPTENTVTYTQTLNLHGTQTRP